jgi:hypothetical protein
MREEKQNLMMIHPSCITTLSLLMKGSSESRYSHMGGESTSPLSYPYADQSQPIQALSFTK